MKNKIELPREFAEKWVAALRSGEYEQGHDYLMRMIENSANEQQYCCLGVACKIVNIEDKMLKYKTFPYEIGDELKQNKMPSILYKNDGGDRSSLVFVLASLNDGVPDPLSFTNLGWEMLKDENGDFYKKYTFENIADFIETNVKFV